MSCLLGAIAAMLHTTNVKCKEYVEARKSVQSLAPRHATPSEEVCSVAAGVPLPTPGIT